MLVKVTLTDDGSTAYINPRHVASVVTYAEEDDEGVDTGRTRVCVSLASGNDYNVEGDIDGVVNALNAAEVH